ncbi:MAG: sulfatase-like hydrolase/transferase [Planctomycetota bacterium]|jgi:arylsulfatase A-like enzyme
MIENLDTSLGMLLDKVDKLGIRESTYVIFTSDNGGGFRGNAPLGGGKANLWEGGIRVPMVVRGPGVRAGCQCDVPVAGWDFLPTISDLVGNGNALPDGIDGGSLRPLFEKGNAGAVRRGTEALVFHFPWYANLPMSAIRLGEYKLMKNLNTGEVRLFNLAEDIGEGTDLSGAMPAKTKELHGLLTEYLTAVDAETVEDMRAARRKELLGYMAKARRKVAELEDQLAKASGAQEKGRLEKKLAEARRSVRRHTSAIDQMERARRMTAW